MTQNIKEGNHEILGVDTTPGMGVYQSLTIPVEAIKKTVELEMDNEKQTQVEYENCTLNNA